MSVSTAFDHLSKVDESTKAKAENYLYSDKVLSVKIFQEFDLVSIEAFIIEKGNKIIMPYLIEENSEIIEFGCQCENHGHLCVHKILLLMAAKLMIENGESDFHDAQMSSAARKLDNAYRELVGAKL